MSDCLDNNTYWDEAVDVWYDADSYDDSTDSEGQDSYSSSTDEYENYSTNENTENNDNSGCYWD